MDVKLGCSCGSVEGLATNISESSGNRVVCCCDDCQKFADFLQHDQSIVDEFGGTEIFQHNFMQPQFQGNNSDQERVLGPVRAYVQTQHALGSPSYPHSAKKFPVGITLRIIRKMLSWKIRGLHKPSVFFNAKGEPVATPKILSQT